MQVQNLNLTAKRTVIIFVRTVVYTEAVRKSSYKNYVTASFWLLPIKLSFRILEAHTTSVDAI